MLLSCSSAVVRLAAARSIDRCNPAPRNAKDAVLGPVGARASWRGSWLDFEDQRMLEPDGAPVAIDVYVDPVLAWNEANAREIVLKFEVAIYGRPTDSLFSCTYTCNDRFFLVSKGQANPDAALILLEVQSKPQLVVCVGVERLNYVPVRLPANTDIGQGHAIQVKRGRHVVGVEIGAQVLGYDVQTVPVQGFGAVRK